MRTAIIIYSKTGNTRSVAEQIHQKMKENNQDVELLEVKAKDENPSNTHVELINAPDINTFNRVIIASPVHAFNPSQIIKTYLYQVDTYENKTIDLFITHHFPFAWMGGNGSLRKMKSIIESKGGIVRYITSINWSHKKRLEDIHQLVEMYSK